MDFNPRKDIRISRDQCHLGGRGLKRWKKFPFLSFSLLLLILLYVWEMCFVWQRVHHVHDETFTYNQSHVIEKFYFMCRMKQIWGKKQKSLVDGRWKQINTWNSFVTTSLKFLIHHLRSEARDICVKGQENGQFCLYLSELHLYFSPVSSLVSIFFIHNCFTNAAPITYIRLWKYLKRN